MLVKWGYISFLRDNAKPLSARNTQEQFWTLSALFYSIHHIYQTSYKMTSIILVIYYIFYFKKRILKNIRWKIFWKTSWARNQLNFTWEELTLFLINGKSWFKILLNIQLIETKLLTNYSWINYKFTKTKLFMIQTNTFIIRSHWKIIIW